MTSRMRRAVALLGLTGALAVIGVTAGPGLARRPLARAARGAGLDVLRPAVPGSGCGASTRRQGRPPIPPLGEDGRATYTAMALDARR